MKDSNNTLKGKCNFVLKSLLYSFHSSFPHILSLDPTDSAGRAEHFTDKETSLGELKENGLKTQSQD